MGNILGYLIFVNLISYAILMTVDFKMVYSRKKMALKIILIFLYTAMISQFIFFRIGEELFEDILIKLIMSMFMAVIIYLLFKKSEFCPNCTAPIQRGYKKLKFCPKCGSPLHPKKDNHSDKSKEIK